VVSKDTILRGVTNAFHVLLELCTIVIPVTVIITFLEHSGWLARIAEYCTPLMALFGLPGETALALVLGNLSNMYAGIGVLAALDLTVKEMTIICAMLLLCHSLLIETAIVFKAGGRPVPVVIGRVFSCMVVGFILNILL
jgi:hypothetical protein